MKKNVNKIASAVAISAVLLSVFAILNVAFLMKIGNDIENLSSKTVSACDELQEAKSNLRAQNKKMAFMAHVLDIRQIIDSYGSKTGSFNSMDFAYLLAKESFKNDLDPLLVLAVIQTESSFRKNIVSHKGAIGLMQVLPNTAHYVSDMNDHIKLSNAYEELFVPEKNITIGINYLSYLIKKFDNKKHALIAYNMGPTNLVRKIKSGHVPDIYYRKIMKNYQYILGKSGRA